MNETAQREGETFDEWNNRVNGPRILARRRAQAARGVEGFVPSYSSWRHGGWYVDNIVHPNGGVGCVSRNFPDRTWRVVCADEQSGLREATFRTRDEAALAELQWAMSRPEVFIEVRA